MKILICLCLAFVAVQVSTAPTDENSPTIILLSADGPKILTPEKQKEIPMENVAEKVEEKQADKTQIKVSEQPASTVEEQPKEVKQEEKPAEKSEKIEKSSSTTEKFQKTDETLKKDEKPVVASKEVESDKHIGSEKKKDDVQKIADHSSLLDQIYNALFGDSHTKHKSVTSSPKVIEISFEQMPVQSKFMEITPEYDDDDDIEVTIVPADAYQSYPSHREDTSMLTPFLRMFNSFNSIPSIFRFGSPMNSSPEPRVRVLGDSRVSRFFA